MKTLRTLPLLILIFGVTASGVCAQSCAATDNFSAAGSHAVKASGEVLASGAASVAGSVQAGAAVVAVPVWMSGQVLHSAGALSTAIGKGADKAGAGMAHGGEQLWDFASGDPEHRPALDRGHAVVPSVSPRSAAKDPSPAEAMKQM